MKLNDTCDTLAKWMAHYLAEQIRTAESATRRVDKVATEDRCCQLILKLWAHRAALPNNARPLGRLDEALKAVRAMRSDCVSFPAMVQRATDQMESPWLTFAIDSYAADKRMACIAFLIGVLESGFGDEKEWLDGHSKHLSTQERAMIDALDKWLKVDIDWLTRAKPRSIAEITPRDRIEVVLKELGDVIREQTKAYKALKKQLGQRRPKSTRRSS